MQMDDSGLLEKKIVMVVQGLDCNGDQKDLKYNHRSKISVWYLFSHVCIVFSRQLLEFSLP